MIDFRLLTFINLAKTRSYTKTAERLNITQPAVTQHIKFLEAYYDTALIQRQGKEFGLTEEGKVLLQYGEAIEAMYNELKVKLKNKYGIIKSYNVGASMTIGGYVLPYILGKYRNLNQNIKILLQVNNTEEILRKLMERKLDFAFVEGLFDKSKFQFKKLKEDELIFVVSSKNSLARQKEVTIEEILKGNLILREHGSGTREIFENKLVELGYNPKDIKEYMEIGSISAIKSLVESNLGHTIISKETVRKELESGSLKMVPIKEVKIYREFNLIYLQKEEEEFIQHFMDYCCQNLL